MDRSGLPNRRSIRLRDYDYTQNSAYFVTICATQRLSLFGELEEGQVHLSAIGQVVASAWEDLPNHTPGLMLDAWVIMPNHLHGVVVLPGAPQPDAHGGTVARRLTPGSLGTVLSGFKSAVSRIVAANDLSLVRPLWQRNYFERVIRGDRELEATRGYTATNPARWDDDPNHPRLL